MAGSASTPDSSDPPLEAGGNQVPARHGGRDPDSDPPSLPSEVSRDSSPAGLGPVVKTTPADLLRRFYSRLSPTTVEAYGQDLRGFATFLTLNSVEVLAAYLAGLSSSEASCLVTDWLDEGRARGLATATIARRLSSVKSLLQAVRTFWGLGIRIDDVAAPKVERLRDTRGPGLQGVDAILELAKVDQDKRGIRNHAIVRLLFDLALRRGEAVSLDLEHVDLVGARLLVLGKGRRQRVPLTLPDRTSDALACWIDVRGLSPGPLFYSLDPARKGSGRLTGRSVARIVGRLGQRAGVAGVRPHGLRHSAVTQALEETGGDVRAVQKFSRHRDLNTVMIYDDNRTDMGGDTAKKVAGSTGRSTSTPPPASPES